jgi:SAM-dependent methyltransferase
MKDYSYSTNAAPFLDKLLQAWRFKKIESFLGKEKIICDLGCGYEGFFLRKIKDKIKKAVGIDVKVDHSYHDSKIELIEADLNGAILFDNETFDIVTSMAVAEHLENYKKHLSEAFRILKKDGLFLLTTPDPKGRFLLEFLSRTGLLERNSIHDHKIYFERRNMINLLNNSGFSNINVKKFQLGFNTLFIAKK